MTIEDTNLIDSVYGPEGERPKVTYMTMIKTDPAGEVAIQSLYTEALRLKGYAVARVILIDADLKPATDDLSIIAGLRKAIEEKRAEYIKPIRGHLDAINQTFKQFTAPLVEADTFNRDKVKAYRGAQELKRAEAEAIEKAKLELARREMALTGETTVDLTPVPAVEVVNKISTGLGTASGFKVRKWEVEDLSKVPLEYLMVDAAKITKLVKAGLGAIPGLRIWEEESLRVTPNKSY